MTDPGYVDLGFACVDTDRLVRTGDPEVVYAAGKTIDEVLAIVGTLRAAAARRPTLVTRATPEMVAALTARWVEGVVERSTVVVGSLPAPAGVVAVVTAGTSDEPVAAEAAMTVRAHGADVVSVTDVGVAGLHRVLGARSVLEDADVVIVIAGMEGALPSVVGGMVGTPVVAVPTSGGYGASFHGLAALLGMLNSCAPGVVVCNIDNGFGAGVFAAGVARSIASGRSGGGAP